MYSFVFFFSSRRRHTRYIGDWSSDVCSSDLDGLPPGVIEAVSAATGLRFCCNRPANGVQVLQELGEHHLRTGDVILYTSADSVLQMAAHVDVLPEADLHA